MPTINYQRTVLTEQDADLQIYLMKTMFTNNTVRHYVSLPERGYAYRERQWKPIVVPSDQPANAYDTQSHEVLHPMRCIECDTPITYKNIGVISLAHNYRENKIPVVACKKCSHGAGHHICDHIGCNMNYAVSDEEDPADVKYWCATHATDHGFIICCQSGYLTKKEEATQYGQFWLNNEYVPKVRFQCQHCGKPVTGGNGFITDDGSKFCSSNCARDAEYRTCSRCGNWFPNNDLNEHDNYNGGAICESCYDEIRYEIHAREPFKEVAATTRGVKPTFGFEVELYRWPEEAHDLWLPRTWGIHEDTTTGSGYEVLTPVMHLEEFGGKFKPTMDYLMNNSEVTRKEGTHMHVGNFKDIDHAMRFFQLATQAEPLWSQWFISKSRRTNQFCLDTADQSVTMKQHGIYTNSRYVKVNAQSYAEHGTIEIRAHHGTLDYVKMHAWATLFGTLWFHALNKLQMPQINNMENWFEDIGLNSSLRNYFKARVFELWGTEMELKDMKPAHTKLPNLYLYCDVFRHPRDINTTWDVVYNLGLTGYRTLSTDDRELWTMLGDALNADENGEVFNVRDYITLTTETNAVTL